MYAIQGISGLSARLREITGRDVIDMNTLMEVIQFLYQQRELAKRGPDYAVDPFGFDAQWTESFLPLFNLMYRDYWRVETTGIENVPATGRALLVSNHAGVLPWDGTMIKTAIFAEHPHPRHVRALVASLFMGMPMLSWFLRRTGQTVGHPDDTRRLLERDELVLVFPEGVKGTGKPFKDRYRLRRFGRGGFVSTAIRAGRSGLCDRFRRDLSHDRGRIAGGQDVRASLLPGHADMAVARRAGHDPAAEQVAHPVPSRGAYRVASAEISRRPEPCDDDLG